MRSSSPMEYHIIEDDEGRDQPSSASSSSSSSSQYYQSPPIAVQHDLSNAQYHRRDNRHLRRHTSCIIETHHDENRIKDIEEIVSRMRKQESSTYRCDDYLAFRPTSNINNNSATTSQAVDSALLPVDELWRQRMCEWMYTVVDHCNFNRSIVAVAAKYLDLCLSKGIAHSGANNLRNRSSFYRDNLNSNMDSTTTTTTTTNKSGSEKLIIDNNTVHTRRTFQLAAMTSLHLAMKLYDSSCIKVDSLVQLGRGLFTVADVVNMENYLLFTLNWNLHPPTPSCYLNHYIELFSTDISPHTKYMIAEISRFIIEISVCVYSKFVSYRPSLLAYAAVLVAIDSIDDSSLNKHQRMIFFVRMARVSKIWNTSRHVCSVQHELSDLFEKSTNVQALMATIDPHNIVSCSRKRKASTNAAGPSTNTSVTSNHQQNNKTPGRQQQPGTTVVQIKDRYDNSGTSTITNTGGNNGSSSTSPRDVSSVPASAPISTRRQQDGINIERKRSYPQGYARQHSV